MRASLFSLASVVTLSGIVTLAACSSPELAEFSSKEDQANATDPGGTFGNTDENGDGTTTTPSGACAPDKGNYDVPGNKCDDDGDGTPDNAAACDGALAELGTAESFAKAIGICDSAAARGFGLVSATFTRGYGRTDAPKPQQAGVLPKFGNVLRPREGARLGVLSSGFAQEYNGGVGRPFGGNAPGVNWWGAMTGGGSAGNGTLPPGFPKGAAGCPQATAANDVINLKLQLKAPKNATGFKFDFNFHSSEWPAFICSEFNDGFIAYVTSQSGTGNISFDARQNPVSVNNGFFDRCTPGATIGCEGDARPGVSQCPAGPAELAGTGFGIMGNYCYGRGGTTTAGGATGWLSSQAPVKPGETFTLELMIWDTGDGDLDSSVLLDNFQWIGGKSVTTSTERPTTPR